jgi:hypothetical protein
MASRHEKYPGVTTASPRVKLNKNRETGGEGGILSPPFLACADESYTFAIIPCVLAGCKLFSTFASVSPVSPIGCDSDENGITGIS